MTVCWDIAELLGKWLLIVVGQSFGNGQESFMDSVVALYCGIWLDLIFKVFSSLNSSVIP